jgi:hypothetical protein
MKTVWRNGCIDPRIIDLGISLRWEVSFTPRPLCPLGKSPSYPLDTRLVSPGTGLDDVEGRIILPLPGHELRPFRRIQSLYRLRYSILHIRSTQKVLLCASVDLISMDDQLCPPYVRFLQNLDVEEWEGWCSSDIVVVVSGGTLLQSRPG